jgi:hypothetical protein
MRTTFAVAALVAGAATLSLPRDGNSKCELSQQGKDAAATVKALMASLTVFGNTLNQFPVDGTATAADFQPLFAGEQLVADNYTAVADAVRCIPTEGPTTDCDFNTVVSLIVQYGNESIVADNALLPKYPALDALSDKLADEFINKGLTPTFFWFSCLNESIPCPYIEPLYAPYAAEIQEYAAFLDAEQLAMHLKRCPAPKSKSYYS